MSQPNEGQDRIDYLETSDITEVHASIAREHAEPRRMYRLLSVVLLR